MLFFAHLTALAAFAAVADMAPPAPTLDLETVLRSARPAPRRLALEAELTAAARELALTRDRLLDAPTLSVETGPRRAPDGDDFDLALGIDLPLATDRVERRGALEAYQRARRDLPAAADLVSTLELQLAYVDAWEASEAVALGERETAAATGWLRAVEARVAAGAEAPYETSLVAAELQNARLALVAARERRLLTWAELRALTEVGDAPLGLLEPAEPAPADPRRAPGVSVLMQAVESRAALDRALAALSAARAGSRWSVGASLAREGDEEVGRLGVGYRVPLSDQAATRAAALEAGNLESARAVELELARLEGRLAGARERIAALASGDLLAPAEVESALTALEARVTAGKDRPSQALPLRRQLVGALTTALSARAARIRAAFEIRALSTESPR